MPSKKRGGLSKREVAAKASGGSLNYKTGKITVAPKPVTRKVAPLSGAVPLMPGQSRVANSYKGGQSNQMDTESYTNDIYNALPSNSPAKISAASNAGDVARATAQRNMAAKAQKNSGGSNYPGLTGNIPAGLSFGGTNTNAPDIAAGLYSGGLSAKGGEGAAPMTKTGRLFQILNDPFHTGANISQSIKQHIGLGGADISGLIGADKYLRDIGGIPTTHAQAMDPTGVANQNILQLGETAIGLPPSIPNNQPSNDTGNSGLSGGLDPSIFDVPTTQSSGNDNQNNDNGNNGNNNHNNNNNNNNNNNFDPSFMGNGEGDANNPYYQDPVKVQNDYNQQQNEQNDGGQGPVDQPAPRVTNQVRGSGLFGTGKGVGNPAGKDDSYIKELRKAYANNGGEKWLRQQFEELIKALDPTYAALQTEGTNALNQNLNNQNNQLASVMNANNTGDSEQRAQMMARQQGDTQTAIGALLAKLAQGKASDVSGYRTQEATQMGQLRDRNQTNQQSLSKGQGRVALGTPAKQKALSHNDIFNWTNEALNQGGSWAEIANQAKANGIDTSTGSYLDQLLNNANKQNRYAA